VVGVTTIVKSMFVSFLTKYQDGLYEESGHSNTRGDGVIVDGRNIQKLSFIVIWD